MENQSDKFDGESDERHLEDTVINSDAKQDTMIIEDINSDVRPNDHKVLETLGEDNSRYTFRGLMRKLGMHQETLARSLHRLDELGLVEKSQLGYRLSSKGELVVRRVGDKPRVEYVPLLQTYIPPNVDAGSLVHALAGKWFKSLRWLGMIEGEMGHMLQWISEDGSFQIMLRIVGNYIIIESNACGNDDKVRAMVSAYRIFEHVSRLYSNRYGAILSYVFANRMAN